MYRETIFVKNNTFICECHLFFVILHPKTTLEGNVSFIWGGFQTYLLSVY